MPYTYWGHASSVCQQSYLYSVSPVNSSKAAMGRFSQRFETLPDMGMDMDERINHFARLRLKSYLRWRVPPHACHSNRGN